jgi:hypothetical protein
VPPAEPQLNESAADISAHAITLAEQHAPTLVAFVLIVIFVLLVGYGMHLFPAWRYHMANRANTAYLKEIIHRLMDKNLK